MVDNKKQNKTAGVSDPGFSPVVAGRAHFLFCGAFVVTIIAIVLPLPSDLLGVIDGLWILCLCMTAAILMLSMVAKDISDLSGFASMLILTAMLRLAVAIVSAKSIIMTQAAGSLIEKIGYLFNFSSGVAAGSVIPFALAAGVSVIFLITREVFRHSSKYAADTLSFKYVSADADLNAGIINESQAVEIKEKIAGQAKFYLSIATAVKFIRFEAVFSILIVALALVGSLTFVSGNSAAGGAAMEVNLALTLGITVVIFIPAIVMAFACRAVMGKKNLSTDKDFKATQSAAMTQNASEQAYNEKMELLNPDFAEVAQRVFAKKIKVKDVSKAAEKTGLQKNAANAVLEQLNQRPLTVLLGSESVKSLPVTEAVNIAVKAAESGKKCLLIDADIERNAVCKVFDIEFCKEADKPVESCIENLSVWSVDTDAGWVGIDLSGKIVKAADMFDCTVVYAPKIIDGEYYGKLAGLVNVALLAVDGYEQSGGQYIHQLKELLESTDCRCILNT